MLGLRHQGQRRPHGVDRRRGERHRSDRVAEAGRGGAQRAAPHAQSTS